MDRVEIKLPADMVIALRDMAEARDESVGQIIRAMIIANLRRTAAAKTPVRADERLVAPLRARLAGDLAHGKSWDDIQKRLKHKGFILRQAGGGLALHRHPTGERLCKASELGFSYAQLMRRLKAPFPNHAHHWLFDRIRAEAHALDEEDIEVIERFRA